MKKSDQIKQSRKENPSLKYSQLAYSRLAANDHSRQQTLLLYKNTLGDGHFARVKKGKAVETKQLCAVKIIGTHKQGSDSKTHRHGIRLAESWQQKNNDELEVLDAMGRLIGLGKRPLSAITQFDPHKHSIYEGKDLCLIDTKYYVIMELAQGISLASWAERVANDHSPVTFHLIREIMLGICKEIAKLHELGYLHRDIKPNNIIVDIDGSTFKDIKLVDFGLAIKTPDRFTKPAVRGTRGFIAPELYRGVSYSTATDIYSFGITLDVLFTYLGLAEEPMLNKLITAMTDPFPYERPTILEIFNYIVQNIPKIDTILTAVKSHEDLCLPVKAFTF